MVGLIVRLRFVVCSVGGLCTLSVIKSDGAELLSEIFVVTSHVLMREVLGGADVAS